MNPLVSIIIPVYNRELLILETLVSIQQQSYHNWECIIVDDHSTDNTQSVVRTFCRENKRFKYYVRPEERLKGANACRNYGFYKSEGSFVNWFDSDDIMHSDFIKLKLEEFEKRKNIDVVISKTKMFQQTINNIIGKENRTFFSETILEDFLTLKIAWYLPDAMWKANFLKNKKLFDENLLVGQDRDFHSRILVDEPIISIIDHYLTFYRKHQKNITDNIDNKNSVLLRKSHLSSLDKLMRILNNKGKLTNTLKLFYFKSVMKYLPFIIKDKSGLKTLINILKKLSFINIYILINWIKFSIAYISLKVFGKGGKLLK